MPEYLSPGVYIEEIPGPQPIEGVSTSTTAMLGVTKKGPTTGKPVFVSSFKEFTDTFGGFIAAPDPDSADYAKWTMSETEGGLWWLFPYAVNGFFANGGQRLFVKRVFSSTATAATASFGAAAIGDLPADDVARLPFTGQAANQPGWNVVFYAKDRGAWAQDKLTVLVQPSRSRQLRAVVRQASPVTGRLAANLPAGSLTTTVTSTDAAFVAAPTPVPIRIGSERLVATIGGGGANTPFTLTLAKPAKIDYAAKTAVRRLRPATTTQAGKLVVEVADVKIDGHVLYDGALVTAGEPQNEQKLVVDANGVSAATNHVTLVAAAGAALPPAFALYEGDPLTIVEAVVDVHYLDGLDEREERFSGLGFAADAPAPFVSTIAKLSKLVEVEITGGNPINGGITPTWALFPGSVDADGSLWQKLAGGDDHLENLSVNDWVGADNGPGQRTGILAFEDVEEVSICAAPGMWARTIQDALITHCEDLRSRFAILDTQDHLTVQEVQAFRQALDSEYAALYYPWLQGLDSTGELVINVPPSGHMAGVYARVDVDRGVHKAPANEVVRQITGFAVDINKREQDLLNPRGINALRAFPDRGLRVWGARTISSTPEWRYVNVRRLFIFVEESIRRGTQWVVFEPNADDLWARVRQSITDFLDIVWRSGALQGLKQAEAFYVNCGLSTMSQADIDAGRLIVEIGLAAVKPAEFVIFRFRQKTGGQPT